MLKYSSYEIHGDRLEIHLKDIQYNLIVKLTYQVFPKEDIIRKQAEIENRTPEVVTLESAQSGVWTMPPGEGYVEPATASPGSCNPLSAVTLSPKPTASGTLSSRQ